MKFGNYLKHLRAKSGLSQTSLAGQLGVTQRYISQIEKGIAPPPSFEVCQKATQVLNLSKEKFHEFISRAAIDRFESAKANEPFVKYLKEYRKSDPNPDTKNEGPRNNICQYDIEWQLLESLTSIEGKLIPFIEREIHAVVSKQKKYKLLSISVQNRIFRLMVQIPPKESIESFSKSLKEHISFECKSKFPEVADCGSKYIWEPSIVLSTVTPDPSIDESSDTYEKHYLLDNLASISDEKSVVPRH